MKNPRTWIGLAISAGCIIWAFWDVNLADLGNTLLHANYLVVVPIMFFSVAILYVRALRWKRLVDPIKLVSAGQLFLATGVGFAINNLLPVRLGEFARAYALAKKQEMPFSTTLATVVLDRLWDFIGLLVLVVPSLAIFEFPEFQSVLGISRAQIVVPIAVATAGLIAMISLMRARPELFVSLVRRAIRPISEKLADRAARTMTAFIQGLGRTDAAPDSSRSFSKRTTNLAALVALSLLVWVCNIFFHWSVVASYGVYLSVSRVLLLAIVIVLALSIPSSPGYIGTYHLAVKKVLEAFGYPPDLALAAAIIMHLASYVPETLFGLYALWKMKLTMSDLRGAKAEESTEG